MISVGSINNEINDAIHSLDLQCNNIQSGLLFCDAFVAKIPSADASVETEFWYAVTNLYGLFFDCAPYVFRSHTQFARKNYTNTKPATLLEILVNNACLSSADKELVEAFIYAVQELRHCFCHNMPPSLFNQARIQKTFGHQLKHWYVFPHLATSEKSPFNYSEGLRVLHKYTLDIFNILKNAISKLDAIIADENKNLDAESIIKDWSRAFVCWYIQSDDVLHRCMFAYYDLNFDRFQSTGKFSQIKEWEKNLPQYVESIAAAFGETETVFLLRWVDDLVEIASVSHTKATAEIILSEFFNEVLS